MLCTNKKIYKKGTFKEITTDSILHLSGENVVYNLLRCQVFLWGTNRILNILNFLIKSTYCFLRNYFVLKFLGTAIFSLSEHIVTFTFLVFSMNSPSI